MSKKIELEIVSQCLGEKGKILKKGTVDSFDEPLANQLLSSGRAVRSEGKKGKQGKQGSQEQE